jgi:hypothetical protein
MWRMLVAELVLPIGREQVLAVVGAWFPELPPWLVGSVGKPRVAELVCSRRPSLIAAGIPALTAAGIPARITTAIRDLIATGIPGLITAWIPERIAAGIPALIATGIPALIATGALERIRPGALERIRPGALELVRMRARVLIVALVGPCAVDSRASVLVGASFHAVVREDIPVPTGRHAVGVPGATVAVRGWTGVAASRAAVLVGARIAELIRPVMRTDTPVWPGHRGLRTALPAAFPLWRSGRLTVLEPVLWSSLPVGPPPLGLIGIPVSGRQRVRPYWPELAQPLFGRGFAEIGLRPLVSGPPAEFHLCRHPANPPQHQHNQRALARPTGTQALPAGAGPPGPSFTSSGPRWSDWPRRSPWACLTDTYGRGRGRALRPTIACTPTRRNPSAGATPTARSSPRCSYRRCGPGARCYGPTAVGRTYPAKPRIVRHDR